MFRSFGLSLSHSTRIPEICELGYEVIKSKYLVKAGVLTKKNSAVAFSFNSLRTNFTLDFVF